MARAIWKGAITFGLVHVPVELYPAEERREFKFSMLDKRDFSPVGYKRYSKKTGKEVEWSDQGSRPRQTAGRRHDRTLEAFGIPEHVSRGFNAADPRKDQGRTNEGSHQARKGRRGRAAFRRGHRSCRAASAESRQGWRE